MSCVCCLQRELNDLKDEHIRLLEQRCGLLEQEVALLQEQVTR